MTATNPNELKDSTESKVCIVSFQSKGNEVDVANDMRQIRKLFEAGMKDTCAPDDYINQSLHDDLKDASSMSTTYFSGRGTFLLLVESENDSVMPSFNDTALELYREGRRGNQRIIKGMVGLQDISTATGTGEDTVDNKQGAGKANFCELRRMSVDSSSRGMGHGAKLVVECISHAKRNKFDGIKLYTGAWMESTIRFYVKMGFEDMGRIEYTKLEGGPVFIAHLQMVF